MSNWYEGLTDPYGSLTFLVGDEHDFVCFDYAVKRDTSGKATRVFIDSTLNSETAHFIETFRSEECAAEDAVAVARSIVSDAYDWCIVNEVNSRPADGDEFIADLQDELRRLA